MRIHKRVVDITCSNEDIKKITAMKIDPGLVFEIGFGKDDDFEEDN